MGKAVVVKEPEVCRTRDQEDTWELVPPSVSNPDNWEKKSKKRKYKKSAREPQLSVNFEETMDDSSLPSLETVKPEEVKAKAPPPSREVEEIVEVKEDEEEQEEKRKVRRRKKKYGS